MNIATESVVVRRDRKTAVLTGDMLRALALTAVKNAIDPDGSADFGAQSATANDDGSMTVSLVIETEVPSAPAPAPASPVAPIASLIPMGIGAPAA